jgi:protein-S-isoprenylcysteine O-methyltransferase Ste14
VTWGRLYFAAQALAGAAWWVAVALSPFVRDATLGSLDPVAVAAFDIPLFVVASAVAAAGVRPAAWVAAVWTVLVAVALAVYATTTAEAGWGVLVMAAAAGCSLLALSLVLRGRVPTEWLIAGPFAFRPAAPRSGSLVHVASTFAQIVVFWGFFLVVLPLVVSALERRWGVGVEPPRFVAGVVAVVGVVVLVLACALGISSAIAMSVRGRGTPLPSAMPNRLVVAGPYRYIRNPMAVAGIVQGAAVGLILGSWLVVAYALIGSLLWNYAVRPLEEVDLEERFGADYRRYRDSVRCWIPRVPRPLA